MQSRHGGPNRGAGFTLVELLVVVVIISLLVAIFLPTFAMVNRRVLRLRCQTNLVKCHRVMLQYAANNRTLLPPFGGANLSDSITWYDGKPHRCVEELKQYGASAKIFTCPAYPGYDNPSDYKWDSWRESRTQTSGTSKVEVVWTGGYIFYPAVWSGLPQNNYRRWHGYFRDGRLLPATVDEPGNPPLGGDELRFNVWSSQFRGFNHEPNAMSDRYSAPTGGGGFTVFLSGAVCWYEWNDLVEDDYQPLSPGLVGWCDSFWAGRKPNDG